MSKMEERKTRRVSRTLKKGSRRARERPQLAFLRFSCGTIVAYQSVSTYRHRGSARPRVTGHWHQ